MRSYVVQFCNRAAKDAKEINVFFEGSEKRNFAIFSKFIRKKLHIYEKNSKFTQTKLKEHENLRENNSPKSYFYFIVTLPLDHVISYFSLKCYLLQCFELHSVVHLYQNFNSVTIISSNNYEKKNNMVMHLCPAVKL